jgi:hypothetical protein
MLNSFKFTRQLGWNDIIEQVLITSFSTNGK